MREQFLMWMCWGFGAASAQILIMLVVHSTIRSIREGRMAREADENVSPTVRYQDTPWIDTRDESSIMPPALRRLTEIHRMMGQRPCTRDVRVCSIMTSCKSEPNANISQDE